MTRAAFGAKRGDIGISAKPCPCRLPLSIADVRPGDAHDSRRHHLHIGSLLFEGVDQIDLTGPFEVLSRIPNATYRIYGKTAAPVRDLKGLRLMPDAALEDAPPLDVLHVPGGFGQEALMDDEVVLAWIRRQAAGACSIFSVCTGALLVGAAGLLKGRRRRRIGPRFTCCRSSAPSRQRTGGRRRRLGLRRRRHGRNRRRPAARGRAARRGRRSRPSSFIWSTRPSRPSTAARRRPPRPRSCSRRGDPCGASRRSASRRRGASRPALGSMSRRSAGLEPR